jgi:ADP-ribose pyrophosphatase YjhB (NUDIX family)
VTVAYRFCPVCASELALITRAEDGGDKERLGRVLLARNAAWPGRFFGLITGFLEAGETPEDGIRREIAEETSLEVDSLNLLGVWDFQRMNQIIIAYHAAARGEITLSPELAEYKLIAPGDVKCWPQGTGQALATWLRSKDIEPQWLDLKRE